MAIVLQPGTPFQVNTHIPDGQAFPAIATLEDGTFVVVWRSRNQDGDGDGVYAQRYDATGAALGMEFRVNATTAGFQSDPQVAAIDGGFVVTFTSPDSFSSGIFAQRFDLSGAAQGAEFRVNATQNGTQSSPNVAAVGDGFAVVWTSVSGDYDIYLQRYDSGGGLIGGETRVNTTLGGDTNEPSITQLSGGGFVVTWTNFATNDDIWARRYDATGAAIGNDFRVNSTITSNQRVPTVVALANDAFVVIWQSEGQDGSGTGIYAQRYDGSGAAVGSEFRVNTTTNGNQSLPAVTQLPDGGFVVAYYSATSGGILAQRYDAAGIAVGGEFATAANSLRPALAALPGGDLALVWDTNDDVRARVISFDATMTTAVDVAAGDATDETVNVDPGGLNAGDDVQLGGGTDTLQFTGAGTYDVTLPTTFTGVERLIGSAGADVVRVNASRLSGLTTIDGAGGADSFELTAGASVDVSGVTFTGFESLLGSTGNETFTATGAQFAGFTSIDMGAGAADRLQLGSAGTLDITLPTTFAGVEQIVGSGGADTIVVDAARFAGLTQLDGGLGTDLLRLATAGTYAFSTAGLSAFEQLEGSAGDDVLRFDASQLASFTTIDGKGGSDTIEIVSGTSVTFAANALANIETIRGSGSDETFQFGSSTLTGVGTLDGGAGNDTIFLQAGTTLDLSGLSSLIGFESVIAGFSGTQTLIVSASTLASISQLYDAGGSGGPDILRLSGGGSLDLSALSAFYGWETLEGGAAADTFVVVGSQANANVGIAQTGAIDGGGGSDRLRFSTGGFLDLSGKTLTSLEAIEG